MIDGLQTGVVDTVTHIPAFLDCQTWWSSGFIVLRLVNKLGHTKAGIYTLVFVVGVGVGGVTPIFFLIFLLVRLN
jgi:hypothetical protein